VSPPRFFTEGILMIAHKTALSKKT
jgi:hypothetical protein